MDHAEPLNKQKWDIPTHPDQLYPSVCWSGGFVESENDDVLEVARDHTEYGSSGAPIHILKRCIVYIQRFKVPPVAKK